MCRYISQRWLMKAVCILLVDSWKKNSVMYFLYCGMIGYETALWLLALLPSELQICSSNSMVQRHDFAPKSESYSRSLYNYIHHPQYVLLDSTQLPLIVLTLNFGAVQMHPRLSSYYDIAVWSFIPGRATIPLSLASIQYVGKTGGLFWHILLMIAFMHLDGRFWKIHLLRNIQLCFATYDYVVHLSP